MRVNRWWHFSCKLVSCIACLLAWSSWPCGSYSPLERSKSPPPFCWSTAKTNTVFIFLRWIQRKDASGVIKQNTELRFSLEWYFRSTSAALELLIKQIFNSAVSFWQEKLMYKSQKFRSKFVHLVWLESLTFVDLFHSKTFILTG